MHQHGCCSGQAHEGNLGLETDFGQCPLAINPIQSAASSVEIVWGALADELPLLPWPAHSDRLLRRGSGRLLGLQQLSLKALNCSSFSL